jgi:hypothetical protein
MNTDIKFHPILFSTPMVQGILEDRKTKTRRTKGLEYVNLNPNNIKFESLGTNPMNENDKNLHAFFTIKNTETWMYFKCPYNVGDILWVRETFEYFESTLDYNSDIIKNTSSIKIQFKADGKISEEISVAKSKAKKALLEIENSKINKSIFHPSIFMPKQACRIFLKIKSIRVERLQDISEDDAKAEGAKNRLRHSDLKVLEGLKNWNIPSPFLEHQFGFLAIWCTINGCDNWEHNPFVWVYEFERIEKPNDFI